MYLLHTFGKDKLFNPNHQIMVITHKQTEIDLSDRLTEEQAEYQYKTAKDENKFDLLAMAKDENGDYLIFKVFPHSLIKRLGFTIVKQNDIKK